jgi:tRNA pseudouridine38-40 synthase
MERGAAQFLGGHDFTSFRCVECVAPNPHRIIYKIGVESHGTALDLVFEGNRFLMHQVRIMAGTLVDVGKGRILADNLPSILEAKDRRRAGQTAPAYGLCLEKVWYQSRWEVGEACPWGEAPRQEDDSLEPGSD